MLKIKDSNWQHGTVYFELYCEALDKEFESVWINRKLITKNVTSIFVIPVTGENTRNGIPKLAALHY